MTTRANREKQSADIIRPFVEEWLPRTGASFAAFRNWAVQQVLWDENLSDEQIEEATAIDGPGDMGIDAWFLADDTKQKILYLIQSKDTRASRDDLSKLRNGFCDLLDPAKNVNANLEARTRAAELSQVIDDETTIEFHLVTSKLVSRNMRSQGQPLFSETVGICGLEVTGSFFVHDVEELADNIRVVHDEAIRAQFTLNEGEFFVYNTHNQFRTVSAAIKANELALLYHRSRVNLFKLNPRYYLSRRSAVNKEILETLNGDDPANFYLYNNGLTATGTAVSVNVAGTGAVLQVEDLQIVNGCQTTVTIYEQWRQGLGTDQLDQVRVPIRVIETPAAKQISSTIARTTNRQNQMKNEDFWSGDPLQERLHAEFDKLSPRWYYEFKRGTWNTDYRTTASRAAYMGEPFGPRRIQMKDLAQAGLAFLGRPDDAVDRVANVFLTEERYRQLFPLNSTAMQLLLPYILFLKADVQAKEHSEEFPWSTSYLRYPMVACVSRLLPGLIGVEISDSYFGPGMAKDFVDTCDEWAYEVFSPVFEELAVAVNREAESGRGVRAMVRRKDWFDEVYDRSWNRLRTILEAEARAAEQAHLDVSSFGLRKALPSTR